MIIIISLANIHYLTWIKIKKREEKNFECEEKSEDLLS